MRRLPRVLTKNQNEKSWIYYASVVKWPLLIALQANEGARYMVYLGGPYFHP
jgi:hypothetical protein